MKTFSAKATDVNRKWYVIDASTATLGRLCTEIATLLTGKGKPMFTHHTDCGDYVIVINTDKLRVTGNKLEDKIYYRHTLYPGGIKSSTLQDKMDKDSTDVIRTAVRGMLPVNKLRPGRLERLKIYSGTEHNHEAQKPEQYQVKEGK